jgi:hypothetical protein
MRSNTLKELVTKNCNPNIVYKCQKGFKLDTIDCNNLLYLYWKKMNKLFKP